MPLTQSELAEKLSTQQLKNIVEAAIFVADKPLSIAWLKDHELADFDIKTKQVKDVIESLQQDYKLRGVQLIEVASGYRFQVGKKISNVIAKASQEKPIKYSRALLETLALIAYKQPVTRGEIEEIRGVAVSSHIMKTISEREWIKIVGHKEVPGRPALYATTKQFLDYFSLNSLEQLPELMPIADSAIHQEGKHDIMLSHDTLTNETET